MQPPSPNSARSQVKNYAARGVEAGLVSVGVPPVLAKRIAPKVLAVLIPALAVVLLLPLMGVVAIIGAVAGSGDDWNVDTETAAKYVSTSYLDAYVRAGEENLVPWTLLAAVGARASYHGRINPYEQDVPAFLLAPPPSTGLPTSVLYIGDSLAVGSAEAVTSQLSESGVGTDVVAEVGQSVSWGLEQLRDAVRSENGLSLLANQDVVIDLGTNTRSPSVFARGINEILSQVETSTRVFWVNLTKPDADEFNQELERARSRWPNLVVIDWADYVRTEGITPDPDGIHYSGNYADRGSFIASIVVAGSSASNGSFLDGPGVMDPGQGDCPRPERPIAGDLPTQAVGPLLLLPDQLAQFDIMINDPQNICDAAEALAVRLSQVRDELVEERGLELNDLVESARNGSTDAAQTVQRFWAEVVDRSGVLGSAGDLACQPPSRDNLSDQEWVAASIEDIWECETAGLGLSLISAASESGGVWSYEQIDPSLSPRQFVQEAIGVAWAFSRWGEQECSADDPGPQGVFPLSLSVFRLFGERDDEGELVGDRCDAEHNIRAAARAFIAEESLPAAQRSTALGPYQPLTGGWSAMTVALGPPEVRATFATNGPWRNPGSIDSCTAAANSFIYTSPTDPANPLQGRTLGEVGDIISENGDSELLAELDAYLDGGADAIARTCTNQPLPASAGWSLLRQVSSGEGLLTVNAPTSGPSASLDDIALPGDVLAAIAAHVRTSASVNATTPVGSEVTALVARLSPTPVTIGAPWRSPRNRSGITGLEIVSTAHQYGGVFKGSIGLSVNGFGLVGSIIPYAEAFNISGQKYQIDPRLLAAIAYQESNFNVEARCDDLDYPGTAGYGMMQEDVSLEDRFERVEICALASTDPDAAAAFQIDKAAEKFLRFLDAVDGDAEGALLAYNSGAALGRFWVEVRPDVEALRAEARRFWCAESPNGWADEATDTLRGCEWRGDVTVRYVDPKPGARSAVSKYREYQMLFPAAVLSAVQTLIGPDGCPIAPPVSQIPNRDVIRSTTIDYYELCVRSVAQAPTPEAAMAIKWAMARAGSPYSQPLRLGASSFDCSSLVMRAYRDGGGLPVPIATTHTLVPWGGRTRPAWSVPVAAYEARPGDLYFPSYGNVLNSAGEPGGHVVMLLADGLMIHAPATGDVVHVRPVYTNEGIEPQVRRVDPGLARLG